MADYSVPFFSDVAFVFSLSNFYTFKESVYVLYEMDIWAERE